VKAKLETPHFELLFRASYGMDRDHLEVYNENIRHGRWRSKPFDRDDPLKRVSPVLLIRLHTNASATPWSVLDILPPSLNVASICVVRTTAMCGDHGSWIPKTPIFTILRTPLATSPKDIPTRRKDLDRRYATNRIGRLTNSIHRTRINSHSPPLSRV